MADSEKANVKNTYVFVPEQALRIKEFMEGREFSDDEAKEYLRTHKST